MAFRNRIVRISQLVFDKLATALTGARVVIETTGGNANRLQMWTGIPHEYSPAMLYSSGSEPSGTNYVANTFLFAAHPQVQERVPASGYQSGQAGVFFDDYYNPPTVVGSSARLAADIVGLQCTTALASPRGTDNRLGIYFNGTPQCFVAGDVAIAGSTPPVGEPKLIKQFTVVVGTDGAGNCVIGYPGGAFPNGIVMVMATSGDATAWIGNATPYAYSMSTVNFACRNPAPANATVRLNVIAIGW